MDKTKKLFNTISKKTDRISAIDHAMALLDYFYDHVISVGLVNDENKKDFTQKSLELRRMIDNSDSLYDDIYKDLENK